MLCETCQRHHSDVAPDHRILIKYASDTSFDPPYQALWPLSEPRRLWWFSCFVRDCEEGLACYEVDPNGSIMGSCSTHAQAFACDMESPVIHIVAKVNTHAEPLPCPLSACLPAYAAGFCGMLQERVVKTMWVGKMLFKFTQPQIDVLTVSTTGETEGSIAEFWCGSDFLLTRRSLDRVRS